MRVHIFLILRFLRLKSGFLLTILALLSVLGIFLSVTALILVTGVISGFQAEIKSRILSLTPHILVQKLGGEEIENTKYVVDKLKMIEGVENVIEYKFAKTLFKNKSFVDGGIIRGLPKEDFPLKEKLRNSILEGEYTEDDNCILLGEYLAYRLRAKVGDSILIIIPLEDKLSPLFFPIRTERFLVAGIFDLGYYEYNASFAFISMRKFKKILKEPTRSLEVVLKEPYDADLIKKKISGVLSYPYYSLTWTEMNKSLFSALKLEKLALFLVLSILVFVSSFMIMGSLFVLMAKKTREIGILMCLGFQKSDIFKIFLMEGLLLGAIGIFSGISVGTLLGFLAGKYKLIKLPPDVYFIDYLPISLNLKDIGLILISSFLIVIFSSTIPAIRASKILPRDALRYE